MAVTISVSGYGFERDTVSTFLKLLKTREFASNDGDELIYTSGRYEIVMSGFIAAGAGEEPAGWDLNNTQIVDLTFRYGSKELHISGLAMDLRETFHAREISSLRDWTDFSPRQEYRFIGTGAQDEIKGSLRGENWLYGRAGDDILIARGHTDHIFGNAGDDIIRIRSNKGSFAGGAGEDKFVLKNHSPDIRISDFDPRKDLLDLRPVLKDLLNGNASKLDKLEFIGRDDFTNRGFEIRADHGRENGVSVITLEASFKGHEVTLLTLWGTDHIGRDDFLF